MPLPKCFPGLISLSAHYWEDVEKLLPGRSVRHLDFAGILPEDTPFAIVATELRNITVLVLHLPLGVHPDGVEPMIPYLAQLRRLNVTSGSLLEVGGTRPLTHYG